MNVVEYNRIQLDNALNVLEASRAEKWHFYIDYEMVQASALAPYVQPDGIVVLNFSPQAVGMFDTKSKENHVIVAMRLKGVEHVFEIPFRAIVAYQLPITVKNEEVAVTVPVPMIAFDVDVEQPKPKGKPALRVVK